VAERSARKLAVILHADVVGSTTLVHRNETLAHERIQDVFHRFSETVTVYGGIAHELRGDALVAGFDRASDAVAASLAFQAENTQFNSTLEGDIQPSLRIGIAMGEVVIADNTVTGDGVVLAQRLEQLVVSGGVCIQDAAYQTVPKRLPFAYENLGERELKGFEDPVRVYAATLKPGSSIPSPEQRVAAAGTKPTWRAIGGAVVAALILVVGGLAWWQPWLPREEPASVERMAFPLPDKPSIAVLPFTNLGDDLEQEYFADGITNDLITDLSKFTNLVVIASNSTFTYKGKPVKVQQVAEDLGVRYVLEGSIQRAGDTIRINAQLIDAISGHHIWADRYDRKADDLFAIQNEIIRTIVGSLNLQVKDTENERALKKSTNDLEAYDYFQRGYAYLRAWGKENTAKAKEMYEKAIELDPQYAQAYAELAFINAREWRYDWIEDTSESLALSLEHARKSVALDPNDYWNVWALGHVYLANGESDKALTAYERALVLNPHDPALLMEMVEMLVSIGRAEQAVAQAKTAVRRNPRHPAWYLWNLGWAEYFAGQHEQAVTTLQKMTEPPNGVRRTLAAALVRIGRIDEAREMIKEYVKNEPDQTVADVRKIKYKHRPYIDKWAGDLLEAGLPEHPPQAQPE